MREINRILCPVDVSDMSRHAIEHAAVLARWYQAKITALHLCNPESVMSCRVRPDVRTIRGGSIEETRRSTGEHEIHALRARRRHARAGGASGSAVDAVAAARALAAFRHPGNQI